jgi:hypothetical protein
MHADEETLYFPRTMPHSIILPFRLAAFILRSAVINAKIEREKPFWSVLTCSLTLARALFFTRTPLHLLSVRSSSQNAQI